MLRKPLPLIYNSTQSQIDIMEVSAIASPVLVITPEPEFRAIKLETDDISRREEIRASTPVSDRLESTVHVAAPSSLTPSATARFVRPWEMSPVTALSHSATPKLSANFIKSPVQQLKFNEPDYLETDMDMISAEESPASSDETPSSASSSRVPSTSSSPPPSVTSHTGRGGDVESRAAAAHSRLVNELAQAVVTLPEHAAWTRLLYTTYEHALQNLRNAQRQMELPNRGDARALTRVRHFYSHHCLKLSGETLARLHEFRTSLRSWHFTTTPPGYLRGHLPAQQRRHSTPNSSGSDASSCSSAIEAPSSSSSSGRNSSGESSVFGNHSSSMEITNTSVSSSSDDTTSPSSETSCRGQLGPEVVAMMKKWYDENFDHPYPSDEMVASFARTGGITKTQVKKWMANRRVRSFNTLSFNGSVHPRRLKRLQRERRAVRPPSATVITSQHWRSFFSGTSPPQTSVSSTGVSPRLPPGSIPRSVGSPSAVLDDWYERHRSYPYPSEMDKEELGLRCGMTRDAVRRWFADRRRHNHVVGSSAAQNSSFISQLTEKLQRL